MSSIYGADLSIATPAALSAEQRVRALRAILRSIAAICSDAEIRYRVSGGRPPRVVIWNGPNGYTLTDTGERVYAVSRTGLPQARRQRAVRVLEILAYGFQDYFARESVCGRGYFVYPILPEHGRAWLASIGRSGGRARTTVKAESSRRNSLRSRSRGKPSSEELARTRRTSE